MKFRALLLISFAVMGSTAMAQFNWPEAAEQRSEAQTLWTLFDDNYKQGDYEAAKPNLEELLEKYPELSPSLYINGIKVWKETRKNEKDAAAKGAATEKVMELYGKRFELFPAEKNKAIDRYAIDAFFFYYRDKPKTRELIDIIKEAYDVKGNNSNYSLGRYYMQMASFGFTRNIGISNDEILSIYDRCVEHIDFQIEKAKGSGKDTKKYVEVKDFVDEKLADLKLIDCNFVVEKLVPEFEANPNDSELANKIFVFAFDGGCTDAEWFTKAAQVVFENDPNYGVGYMLGVKFGADKDYATSKDYFMKAVELTEDNTDKGKALKQIASTERINGNKTEARNYAIQAAEVDPTLKEDMYVMIGDMIMGSSECDKRESQIDDRARFIAAYDYYMQAGSRTKAAAAKAQFPTIGDIFTANKEEGEKINVGCWIQKTVSLQRRPEQ